MGDEVDAKNVTFHLVHCQRRAVQCDGAFGRNETGQITGRAELDAGAVSLFADIEHLGHAIDVARDNMPAQFVTDFQGPFQVQLVPDSPEIAADVRGIDAFGRDFHIEPVLRLAPQRDHSQTHTITGNRSTNINCIRVIGGPDPGAQITALFDLKHLSDISDNSSKHAGSLPVLAPEVAPDGQTDNAFCEGQLQGLNFAKHIGHTERQRINGMTLAVTDPTKRHFLFLQGPHGPFFHRLGMMMRTAGCAVSRVGFNAGDRAFWFGKPGYIPFTGGPDDWADTFTAILDQRDITDIVLYGDTRPIHAEAVVIAKDRGLTVHVFEEGYMRPYWVTYERDGSNGHSRLMDLSLDDMQQALALSDLEVPTPPAHWGDMRQHVFYGALYHWFVMFLNHAYRRGARHRDLPVTTEAYLYSKRLILMPWIAIDRMIASMRIRHGGFPYHLVLMQLEHDASFQKHSPFTRISEFIDVVMAGFAEGAPLHHHLVFKAHPLENDRSPIRRLIREAAAKHKVGNRVHYVRGGKLAKLLDQARTAVTVNSTAGQQVLWRGIPLKVFGQAVYSKPAFVSEQPLAAFFANPSRPDSRAYKDYRRFLLETSQVPGGFYAARGRRQLLRQVVDMMLAPEDPYDALKAGKTPPRQPLRMVT